VPEAAIHEHDHFGRPEHDVASASHTGQNGTVYAVAQPTGMQQAPERYLRLGIPLADAGHPLAREL